MVHHHHQMSVKVFYDHSVFRIGITNIVCLCVYDVFFGGSPSKKICIAKKNKNENGADAISLVSKHWGGGVAINIEFSTIFYLYGPFRRDARDNKNTTTK